MALQWIPLVKIGTVKLVLYEDLKSNTIFEIDKVVKFLNVKNNMDSSEYEQRLSCIRSNSEGKFKRKKSQEQEMEEWKVFAETGI